MTLEQLDAVLKAFAWQDWESLKSSAPATLSYNHYKTINAGKIYSYLTISRTYNHPIYIQFICKDDLKGDALLIPTEASAAEAYLMTMRALIQAEKKLEDFVGVI
jgi:hypothetical protein